MILVQVTSKASPEKAITVIAGDACQESDWASRAEISNNFLRGTRRWGQRYRRLAQAASVTACYCNV